jgi:peptidoglycan hydrolase-like protein with peptidoglycan-binding domain
MPILLLMPGGTLFYSIDPVLMTPRVRGARRRPLENRLTVLAVSVGLVAGAFGSVGAAAAAPLPGLAAQVPGAPAAPSFSVGLHQGSVGPQVKSLQQTLIASGINVVGGADGIYGAATVAAVSAFQTARGLAVSGEVDAPTLAALSGAPAAAAAPAATAAVPGDLALGAKGDAVKALQQALATAGVFVPGGADGTFGSGTQTAVKNFQRWNGLEVTGVVNAATAAKLKLTGAPTPAAAPAAAAANPYVGLKTGSQGTLVKALQQALIAAGVSIRGGADGSFGAATATALQAFQTAKGIAASGTVDDATAAALGLGVAASATPAAPAAPAASSNPYVGLKMGAQGDRVKDLQRALIQTGLVLRGGADGSFGLATKTALTSFQKVNGIEQSGIVGDKDAGLLGLTSSGASTPQGISSGSGYPVFGESSDRVKSMQTALLTSGIKVPGGADGKFGSGTAGAIMEYQRREGLPVSGKIDDATAGKLGQAPAPGPVAPSAAGVTLSVFPVQGNCWFGDTWHAPRGGGRLHEGVDIIAAQGQQLYAVVDGTITKQYWDFPGAMPGNGLRVSQDNGTYFTYLHLSAFAPGIAEGTKVKAGQLIGYVGTTGSSATPHLHFEVHPSAGGAVNPYPLVKAIDACSITTPRA